MKIYVLYNYIHINSLTSPFYTPTKRCGRILSSPHPLRPSVRPSVCLSVHNCLYRLHFQMDFFFYLWGVGQYHKYDFPHQIWSRSDDFSRIQKILSILKSSSIVIQNALSYVKIGLITTKFNRDHVLA